MSHPGHWAPGSTKVRRVAHRHWLKPERVGRPCDVPGCAARADQYMYGLPASSHFRTKKGGATACRSLDLDIPQIFARSARLGGQAVGAPQHAPRLLEAFVKKLAKEDIVVEARASAFTDWRFSGRSAGRRRKLQNEGFTFREASHHRPAVRRALSLYLRQN